MKKRSLILSLLIPLFFVSGAFAATNVNFPYYSDSEKYVIGNGTINQQIKSLKIDWVCTAVTIKYHSKDYISLEESNVDKLKPEEKIHWYLQEDGTLNVRFCGSRQEFKTNNDHSLTVLLPRSINLENLYVSASVAEVNIANIISDSVKIITTSGNVIGSFNKDMKNLNVSSSSGALDLYFGNVEKAEFEAAGGAIKVNGNNISNLSSINTSGITNIVVKDVTNAMLISRSGSISAKMDSADNLKIQTDSGDKNIDLKKVKNIDLASESGSSTINVTEQLIGGAIKSASGKVSINISKDIDLSAEVITSSGSTKTDLFVIHEEGRNCTVSTKLLAGKVTLFVTTKSGNIEAYFNK